MAKNYVTGHEPRWKVLLLYFFCTFVFVSGIIVFLISSSALIGIFPFDFYSTICLNIFKWNVDKKDLYWVVFLSLLVVMLALMPVAKYYEKRELTKVIEFTDSLREKS